MRGNHVRFRLDQRPITTAERSALSADLELLGVDDSLLDAYSATVSRRSDLTRPAFLRAEVDGRLLGIAVVFVCRDSGVSFFTDPRPRDLIRRLPPIWYWERGSLGTDGHAGPGLVAPGIDRDTFADAAMSWLSRRYVMGAVIDAPASVCPVPHVTWPGLGVSTLPAARDGVQRLLGEHRNLGRKVRKFVSQGGVIERVSGALPASVRSELMEGYAQHRPNNPPFREMYPMMVQRQWDMPAARLEHLIARINGQIVGYHTFLHTGTRLVLLSGVFSRLPSGNVHAYENVLLGSIDLASHLGCTLIDYGGTVNDVKASLLDTAPTRIRFVSRVAPLRAGLRALLPHTTLAGLRTPGAATATRRTEAT